MSGLKCFWRKMGAFLVDILRLDQPEKGRGTLQKELTALQVGRKETIRAYWIRKICCVLAAGMIGILLAAVSFGCQRKSGFKGAWTDVAYGSCDMDRNGSAGSSSG